MPALNETELREVVKRVLAWSRERAFAGYSKHDALNSPFLKAVSLNRPLLRLAITQAVMRCPFNPRPWLGVKPGRNPKGIGLFAHAMLDLAQTASIPSERDAWLAGANDLLAWLVRNTSPQTPHPDILTPRIANAAPSVGAQTETPREPLKGLGWGYHYPWQDQGFFQPAHYPNRVVTAWVGFAFLRACELGATPEYLAICHQIATFLLDNPRALYEDRDQLCLSYVPLKDIRWAVMDVSALAAAFLARFAALLGGNHPAAARYRDQARRLMAFVVDKQTDYGGWFYTWPAGDSHIKHDNYHTAIILDCLADYMEAASDRAWTGVYRRGLAYYRKQLFTPAGAPRWMNNRTWPHDIHGAASGILAFTRAARFEGAPHGSHAAWADTIIRWTLRNLYDSKGFFYYQKTRAGTKRFCLMRWCNAWMCRALAQRLCLMR